MTCILMYRHSELGLFAAADTFGVCPSGNSPRLPPKVVYSERGNAIISLSGSEMIGFFTLKRFDQVVCDPTIPLDIRIRDFITGCREDVVAIKEAISAQSGATIFAHFRDQSVGVSITSDNDGVRFSFGVHTNHILGHGSGGPIAQGALLALINMSEPKTVASIKNAMKDAVRCTFDKRVGCGGDVTIKHLPKKKVQL